MGIPASATGLLAYRLLVSGLSMENVLSVRFSDLAGHTEKPARIALSL
jgi:hypothetical protein